MCEDIMFSFEHSLGIYVVISFILVTCLLDIVLISTDINPLALKLPRVIKTEFLFTVSIQCQADG